MAVSYASNRVTIGSYKSGTTGTSGTNTLVSTGTPFVAGDVGRYIAIKPTLDTSSTYQVRRITGFNSSSSVTVHDDWVGGAPASGIAWVMSHNCQDVHDIGDAALEKIGSQSYRWDADFKISVDGFFADADVSLETTFGGGAKMELSTRSICQFGTLIGGEGNNSKEVVNGCRLSLVSTATTTNQDVFVNTFVGGAYDENGFVLNIYGSLVESNKDSSAYMFGRYSGPVRFIGSIFDGQLGGRFAHPATELVNCSFAGNNNTTAAWSLGAEFIRAIENVRYGSNLAAIKTYLGFSGSFRDCTFFDTNTDYVRIEGNTLAGVVKFIDCTNITPGKIDIFGTSLSTLRQIRSINYTTVDAAESPVVGVNVAVYNASDILQGSVQTSDGSGVVGEIEAVYSEYLGTTTEVTYSPFSIRLRAYDYRMQEINTSMSAKIKQAYVMPANAFTTASAVTAAAYTDRVSINSTAKTVTVTAACTKENLYDYCQYWAAQSANMAHDVPLETTDGISFVLATGWTLILDNALTGGINVTGDVSLSAVFNLDGHNITGTLDFTTAGTYVFNNLTITEVTNSSLGAVTINTTGGLTVTTNTGPDITINTPTEVLRINPDVNITGSIRYFDGTPTDQDVTGSGTGDYLDYTYSTTDPIDIEVVEQGYVPVNQQNVTPINGTLTIEMDLDEAYNASHALTIVTHYTFDRGTKNFNFLADQNAFDVRSSMADTIRLNSSYFNTPLLLEAKPGGKRIDLIDGATITSMETWKGAGMERYDALGTIYPIEKWYAIQSVQDITGASVIYRQTNSGDFTIGALTGGKFDETLKFYEDTTVPPDNNPETNNDSYLLIKALRVGYRQARNDVVAGNGGASLKADLYTIGLAPTAHDYAGGPIDLSASMALTYGPFTVGVKTISYKWTDSATNSGTDIADWINYMGATSPNGLIPGGTGLRWAEMPDMVIYVSGGVETAQGYREGATPTLVGFYMERGGSDHPDLVRAQADDGTYYTPAQSATVTINNITTTSRVQLYDTANSVELYNDVPGATSYQFSETYSVDRTVRARITDVVGATAKKMIEATVGSISTSSYNISYIASQENDTTYNTNAIDGSTVTGITIDDSTDLVNINIAGGSVTWPQIYAYEVYWLNTATGIQDDFAFIDAPDTANYKLTSFQIKNTSSPSVPLIISSGYGVDSTTGSSVDLVDTSGGTLIFAPDHVVPFSTGSGLTAGQDAAITAIKSKTDSLTFTVAGQVDANCESMNAHALQGDGSESDKIRTVNAP